MYDLDQLWDEFESLNNLRRKWADNEGSNNDAHRCMDEGCKKIYDILIDRFQQKRIREVCAGCEIRNNKPTGYVSEWLCASVGKDWVSGKLLGEFYCKECNNKVVIGVDGNYPHFKRANSV